MQELLTVSKQESIINYCDEQWMQCIVFTF